MGRWSLFVALNLPNYLDLYFYYSGFCACVEEVKNFPVRHISVVFFIESYGTLVLYNVKYCLWTARGRPIFVIFKISVEQAQWNRCWFKHILSLYIHKKWVWATSSFNIGFCSSPTIYYKIQNIIIKRLSSTDSLTKLLEKTREMKSKEGNSEKK